MPAPIAVRLSILAVFIVCDPIIQNAAAGAAVSGAVPGYTVTNKGYDVK
jgi:hypothetical protein